jgi:hypothetical protein
MTLTQHELNTKGCSNPDCDHDHSILYISPGCHDDGGTVIRYEKTTGEIVISCDVCERDVVRILVAEK